MSLILMGGFLGILQWECFLCSTFLRSFFKQKKLMIWTFILEPHEWSKQNPLLIFHWHFLMCFIFKILISYVKKNHIDQLTYCLLTSLLDAITASSSFSFFLHKYKFLYNCWHILNLFPNFGTPCPPLQSLSDFQLYF